MKCKLVVLSGYGHENIRRLIWTNSTSKKNRPLMIISSLLSILSSCNDAHRQGLVYKPDLQNSIKSKKVAAPMKFAAATSVPLLPTALHVHAHHDCCTLNLQLQNNVVLKLVHKLIP